MISFSPPRIDQKILDEVCNALTSGWITTGPKTKLFEEKITEYAGHKATLCTNSCSSGLELMLKWFGVKEGDEVIVPAYTYAASANVIVHCGAKPVFVDSASDFNLSIKAVKQAITPKTKVILPVDLAGWPCDYDELNDLVCEKSVREKFVPETIEQETLGRILILSDAAHSIGAKYKGRKTGILTDVTVYSFHAVKNLTTAEGGAICLNLPKPFDNKAVYDYLKIKSLHGQTKDAFSKNQIGNWKYDILEAGYKYNMTDVQAAMGLVELERYDKDMIVKRKHIFDSYSEALSKYSWAEIPVYENEIKKSSYHAFLLRIRNISESDRDKIIQKIFQREVAVNVHFLPLPMTTFYKNLGNKIEDFPVVFDNYSREISLPVYYDLNDEQVRLVIEAVVDSVKEVMEKWNNGVME
jgi:dTDP-4-amino-4,6-dideoxygalactose transaminase